MISCYLGLESGKKTAFLEVNDHRDLNIIERAYDWDKIDSTTFSFGNITCYKEVDTGRISEIMNISYDYYILDFGTDFAENITEFLRCDTKLIIGGGSGWSKYKYYNFFHMIQKVNGNEVWLQLAPFADHKTILRLRKEYGRSVYMVPYEADPIRLSKETQQLFETLFIED
jgi:hypothetical protein